MEEGLNFTWATWLVDAAPSFDAFVTLELDKYDACMAAGETCPLPRLLAIGVYDQHITDYMDVFPQHFFCIVDNVRLCILPVRLILIMVCMHVSVNCSSLPHTPQDFLAQNSAKAMSIVSTFIGLPPIDWAMYDFIGNNTISHNLHETVDDLPVDKVVVQRIQAFYDSQPHSYYEHVRKHGYYGCRPDLAVE